MAVERVWFPHVPDGTIDAADRSRQGIGYGGIIIAGLASELRLCVYSPLSQKLSLQSTLTQTKKVKSLLAQLLKVNSTRN